MMTLGGLLKPASGTLLLDGKPYPVKPYEVLAQGICLVLI